MVNPSLKEGVKRRERLVCLLSKFFIFRIPYINTLKTEKKLLFFNFFFSLLDDFAGNGYFVFFPLFFMMIFYRNTWQLSGEIPSKLNVIY